MTSAQRLTPADRNRATERLRTITVGITLASVAATLGFSAAAALSNPGKAVATTSTTTNSSSDTSTSASGGSGTTVPFQSSVGIGSFFGGGRSHAVSGGS